MSSEEETMTPPVGIEDKQEGSTSPRPARYLLPEIPDEITLNEITPKLSWIDICALSSVSSAWRKAIETRKVYDARVRWNSTETLVLINHTCSEKSNAIVLYSITSNSYYHLPPIPDVVGGIPRFCRSVSMDGKIYVLEGLTSKGHITRMFVFDLAGKRKWERCPNLLERREAFACGVKDGKIYVFGGGFALLPVCESEVYDPETKKWSQISPLNSLRVYCHGAQIAGGEFYIHGGMYLDQDYLTYDLDGSRSNDTWPVELDLAFDRHLHPAEFLDVYNPEKDEWRVINTFQKPRDSTLFTKDGKFHAMGHTRRTQWAIFVHDADKNSWKRLIVSSFVAVGPLNSTSVTPLAVREVDGELLAIVHWYTTHGAKTTGIRLLRGKGLGSKIPKIKWEKTLLSLSLEGISPQQAVFSMHTIQL